MADLAVLRTAKMAFDEGLITQDDYDTIKKGFLRAQQIRAGLDAGFIREEDYNQARDSFLHALDFSISPSASASLGLQSFPLSQPISNSMPPSPIKPFQSVPAAPAPAPSAFARPPQSSSRSATPQRDQVAPQPAHHGNSSGSILSQVPLPASQHAAGARNSFGQGTGTVPMPTDLPRMGRSNSVSNMAGKKSIAGIGVNEQCTNVFLHIKTKSAYKWVSFKVNDEGTEVVVDQLGAQDSSYNQFVAAMPDSQCRYAVYDYAYLNADTQQTVNKLVFVHWAPESGSIKNKMMYASTKEILKGSLEGIGAELQATDANELSEQEMRDRVHQAMTRK